MRSQILPALSVPVTSPSTLCRVYDSIAEELQWKAKAIVAVGKVPTEYDEFFEDGVLQSPTGKMYLLNPKADFPFLFAALKLHGRHDEADEDAVACVFRMVRDAAKACLPEETYRQLQRFVTQKSREGVQFKDVYSELCALLGR